LKDEDKEGEYCVEFTKMNGANYPFTQIYEDIKNNPLSFANEKPACEMGEAGAE